MQPDMHTCIQVRRLLLDSLLLLLARGSVLPVLTTLTGWLREADHSLVRHLLQKLLALAAPPYSEPFGRQVLLMFRQPRTLDAHRAAESRKPLVAFTRAARELM